MASDLDFKIVKSNLDNASKGEAFYSLDIENSYCYITIGYFGNYIEEKKNNALNGSFCSIRFRKVYKPMECFDIANGHFYLKPDVPLEYMSLCDIDMRIEMLKGTKLVFPHFLKVFNKYFPNCYEEEV